MSKVEQSAADDDTTKINKQTSRSARCMVCSGRYVKKNQVRIILFIVCQDIYC